jgi:hypothetical protein
LLLLGNPVSGQTACAIEHTDPGVFICFPNPAGASVPNVFHVSAQGNAWKGSRINHYIIYLDRSVAYESRLATPAQRLSIEVNLRSSLISGSHTLRVVIDGAGTAEIKELQLHHSKNRGFCAPASSLPSAACTPSGLGTALSWSPTEFQSKTPDAGHPRAVTEQSAAYAAYRELYDQNLKSLEADTAEAIAVDSRGNLYVVIHLFTGLELRKYRLDGSIIYDSVIPTCGPGLLSVSGLAIDNTGHAWIGGSTTACLNTTSGAWLGNVRDTALRHGFVIMLDTSSPSSTAPRYATYLADAENEVTAIRADREGNAYVTGITKSAAFPHDFSFDLKGSNNAGRIEKRSFVSVLNVSGSGLRWSALMDEAELTALALDSAGNVFFTGRADALSNDLVIGELSANGKNLSYLASLDFMGKAEGRAISISSDDKWVLIAGDTDSPDHQKSRSGRTRTFLAALQPCTKRMVVSSAVSEDGNSVGTEVSMGPTLDVFASTLPGDLSTLPAEDMSVNHKIFHIAPACAAEIR